MFTVIRNILEKLFLKKKKTSHFFKITVKINKSILVGSKWRESARGERSLKENESRMRKSEGRETIKKKN